MRAACLTLLLAACSSAGQESEWSLRFEDSTIASEAVRVEAYVFADGCDGPLLYRADVPSMGAGPPPPVLAPGRYGLAASAVGRSCAILARGCVEATFPLARGARIVVPITRAPGPPACEERACTAGRCENGAEHDGGFTPSDGGIVVGDAGSDPISGCDAEDGGRCYRIRGTPQSWDDAEASCQTWGGHLVRPRDAAEEDFLRTAGAPSEYWLGFSDAASEGSFVGPVGDVLTYSRWAPGAPRSTPPWRDCVLSSGSGWTDENCSDQAPYVCER